MMKCMAPLASHNVLRKGDEFWDASRTIQELHKGKYFEIAEDGDTNKRSTKPEKSDITHWPSILRAVVDGGKDGAMALSALGGAIWHIRRALIDHDLLSMQRFGAYIPSDQKDVGASSLARTGVSPGSTDDQEMANLPSASSLPGSSTGASQQSHMVLDGVSLSNLEVLRNSCDGGEKGSLWGFVNRCSTAFGKRLLKDWVMKPLLMPRYAVWSYRSHYCSLGRRVAA